MRFALASCSLKPSTLEECLNENGLGKDVLEKFEKQGISDPELALRLDNVELQELGVQTMGQRLKVRDTLTAASAAKKRFLWNVVEPMGSMKHGTVISLLTNMGVVSALLASLLFGIIMTIPQEEVYLGDKRQLSFNSLAFRCQFADWSDPDMTLEICSPELTALNVQKAMSPIDVSCNDGKDWSDPTCRMELCNRSEFVDFNNEIDAEDKRRMRASFLTAGDVSRMLSPWSDEMNQFIEAQSGRPSSHGCTARAFQLAERVASTVSDPDYLDFVYSWQADDDGIIQDAAYHHHIEVTSDNISKNGFWACYQLMAVVFLSLYGIISLSVTDAESNQAEMNLWWLLGGFAVVATALVLTINGCRSFMIALEYVIVLRFPLQTQHVVWKVSIMDLFRSTWLQAVPIVLGIHYAVIRLLSVLLALQTSKTRNVVVVKTDPKPPNI